MKNTLFGGCADNNIAIIFTPIMPQVADKSKNMTKEQLIKNLKKEAQKATSKVIASTFDQNIRNSATRQIQMILADKIKEVQAL